MHSPRKAPSFIGSWNQVALHRKHPTEPKHKPPHQSAYSRERFRHTWPQRKRPPNPQKAKIPNARPKSRLHQSYPLPQKQCLPSPRKKCSQASPAKKKYLRRRKCWKTLQFSSSKTSLAWIRSSMTLSLSSLPGSFFQNLRCAPPSLTCGG